MGDFITLNNSDESYAYTPINGFTTVDIGRERGNNVYVLIPLGK